MFFQLSAHACWTYLIGDEKSQETALRITSGLYELYEWRE